MEPLAHISAICRGRSSQVMWACGGCVFKPQTDTAPSPWVLQVLPFLRGCSFFSLSTLWSLGEHTVPCVGPGPLAVGNQEEDVMSVRWV